MAKWHGVCFAVGFLAIFQAWPSRAADEKRCLLHRVVGLDMHFNQAGIPVVPLPLMGQPRSFLVDTGGVFSGLRESSAIAMGLRLETVDHGVIRGFDGKSFDHKAWAPGFMLGQIPLPNYEFMILPDNKDPDNDDGVLGADLLSRLDVDFDFAHMKLNLLVPSECGDGVVYWSNGFTRLPFKTDDSFVKPDGSRVDGQHIYINAKLDGADMKALVDTGSTYSVMTMAQAKFIMGWHDLPPELQKLPDATDIYTFPFKTLTFGGITVSNPLVHIYDAKPAIVDPRRDIILGMDVLRRLHMYVAYGTRTIYLTPKDGMPAASTPQAGTADSASNTPAH